MNRKFFLTAAALLGGMLHALTAGAQAMYINPQGDVGVGTDTPSTPLHVFRDDGAAMIFVEEANASPAGRTLFMLANPGNTKFEILESNSGNSWAFTNSGNDFRVSLQNSGTVEFRVFNNGNAELAGLLQENSDRNAKTNIKPVDPDTVLEKVTRVPIAQWSYKDAPEAHHIGPMAQDFRAAFGTGSSETSLATMDVGGVAIASIQALEQRNQTLKGSVEELSAQNAQLASKNAELEDRLELLEALVTQLLPQTAHQ
jgi:hypothetical protein